MPIRVWSNPSASAVADRSNGIAQVIHYLEKQLVQRDFQYVKYADAADIIVRHAGAKGGTHVDVAHCHGLMPTAMKTSSKWEWAVNHDVIDNLVRASVITVPSAWVADIIRRDMRVNPYIIPWGINFSEWQPGDTRRYVLWGKGRSHGVNDPSYLNALARIAPSHNFITTFGDESLQNLKTLGVIPFEQMKKWIREAEVYLATTRETFGIQTLEAMACGVPVLGFDWAATPELVFHKETGYLVKPGDIEGLREGLSYCIQNRTRLGEAARELARTYTWEATADSVAEVYRMAHAAHTAPDVEVSIIIPCYNYAQWVGDAITSAMGQQGPSHEVIVVNDASTDNSREVIDSYAGHVVVVHKTKNEGVAAARNTGARLARGRFLVFLDADDMLEPEWLRSTMAAMKDSRVGISYTRLKLLTPDGMRDAGWPPCPSDLQALLRCQNTVPTCCLIRREAFERAGGYRSRFEPTEDGELWTRIAECGYDVLCASIKPLFTYRMGHPSLSRGKKLPPYEAWHIPSCTGKPPFAAISPIENGSYPVRDYDQPVVSVVILHPEAASAQDLTERLDQLLGQTFRFWEVCICGEGPYPDLRAYPFVRILEEPLEFMHAPLVFVINSSDNIEDARTLEKSIASWQTVGMVKSLLPYKWLVKTGGIHFGDTRESVYKRVKINV